jgi:protein-S-isoprenylcysteine O-methyltransferase Ste14
MEGLQSMISNASQAPLNIAPQTARRRALASMVAFSVVLPAMMFAAAGRLNWGMGWLFVALLWTVTFGSRLVAARRHPGLLEERATSIYRADTKKPEKVMLSLIIGLSPMAMMLVAGFSQRFAWGPRVPVACQWGASLAALAGGLFSGWAMAANPFFSAVVRIQRERGHEVVSNGPYRLVRHPGYAGAVLYNLAVPLMLDAAWAFVPAGITIMASIMRTAEEDAMLRAELPGYAEYSARTRYRLIPGVW